jgi:chemotaxis protein MotB
MRTHLVPVLVAVLVAGCVKKSTYESALAENNRLKQHAIATEGNLNARIQGLQEALDRLEKTRKSGEAELGRVRGEKSATEQELAELRRQKDAAEKRIAAYKALQQKFRALVDTGKLQVVFRNGQMMLKLPSSILFASGSADLSKAGQAALGEVVDVLMQFKDRRFVVAGHTDNQPIRTRAFKNNWYLSTARANSVVQFMIQQKFPATNLAAAGYGEFDPVAANDKEPNRELNRRIELILVPNLEELPTLAGVTP